MTTRKIDSDTVTAFCTAPKDQGQMIERSYAWVDGGDMVERVTDRSTGSTEMFLLLLSVCHAEVDVPNGVTPRARDILTRTPCVLVGA